MSAAQAGDALGRFLAWHQAERGRFVVASEHRFVVELSVGGRPVVLRGSMDRVEVDAEGFVHVVDLKTGKVAPTAREVAEHVQLAVYLAAVAEGAVTGLAGDRPGGAELVLLKHGLRDGLPKVARQPPAEPDDDGRTPVDRLLARAVVRLTEEDFPATPSQHCGYCEFRSVCPAQDEGRQVVR